MWFRAHAHKSIQTSNRNFILEVLLARGRKIEGGAAHKGHVQ